MSIAQRSIVKILEGKKALVTGGAKRLGRLIALALAEHGCDLLVHYNTSHVQAEDLLAQIKKLGRSAYIVQADFRDPRAPSILHAAVEKYFGALDILVNNASNFPEPERVASSSDIFSETLTQWEESLAVNARTPFFLIQKLAPFLKHSTQGVIVNLLDSSRNVPFLSRPSHSISKWALDCITQVASASFPDNVSVLGVELENVLAPEFMESKERDSLCWQASSDAVENLISLIANPQAA